MEQEISLVLSYLDKIGEKLGIGANMLWPYVMKQQTIEGYLCLSLMALFGLLFFVSWKIYAKAEDRHAQNWTDMTVIKNASWIVFLVLTIVAFLVFVFHGIFQLVNTEYMAFKSLVELLKSVK